MVCEHCGTEHAHIHDVSTMRACRDALKSQLASMTKRAEDAERDTNGQMTITNRLSDALSAAEAKLATAVAGLRKIMRLEERDSLVVMVALDTFRALGIDPSKEQGK